MAKHIEHKIKTLRGFSRSIDALFNTGKTVEAEELLSKAIEESVEVKAYHLFFQGEAAGYLQEDRSKQEEYFREAIAIRPDDFFLSRNLGVCLSKLGREAEAIVCFDQALEENPKDSESMRYKGVCLSKLGRGAEAIVCFDQALKESPNDYLSYREWSVTEFNRGNYPEALEKIKRAYELSPDNESLRQDLEYLAKYAGMNARKIINELGKGRETARADVGSVLASFTLRVQEIFKPRIEEFVAKMAETENRRKEFLQSESNMKADLSYLLVLRKWNSFTPAIPSSSAERSVGGGYYIRHNGKGIVIDPGYNFIENFVNAGGKIVDIDNIVITHAHNDHTNDFESLMSLLYRYNRDNRASKQVKVFMNTGSFKKFSGLLDLRGCDYFEGIYSLTKGAEHLLGHGVRLRALPAYHDEVISKHYAVGVLLSLDMGGEEKNILFTSDTGLFPKNKKDGYDIADTNGPEIHTLYEPYIAGKTINLLVPHLGSIKEKEITTSIYSALDEAFYPNHLGALGTIRLITEIRPNLAIVSEFGEELRDFREDLATLLRGSVEKFFEGEDHCPCVLPGDLPLIYDIRDEKIWCVLGEEMTDYRKMNAKLLTLPGKQGYSDCFFYYSADKQDKVDKIVGFCKSFVGKLESKEAPYLK